MKSKEELANEWNPKLGGSFYNTLEEELAAMQPFKLNQSEVPLIIKLTENPKYDIGIFPGSVSLYSHDCIHILLGRGVLPKDEAFVIGFTMGSTGRMNLSRESLFTFVTQYLYPEGYRFSSEDLLVFKMGIWLSSRMNCKDLSSINFKKYKNQKLASIRKDMGLDIKSLRYYYYLEKQTFPNCKESQRLI